MLPEVVVAGCVGNTGYIASEVLARTRRQVSLQFLQVCHQPCLRFAANVLAVKIILLTVEIPSEPTRNDSLDPRLSVFREQDHELRLRLDKILGHEERFQDGVVY